MKVQELRELLKKTDRERIEKAFAECYKQLPKAKKQEVDDVISAIFAGEDVKGGKVEKQTDFEALKLEVEDFIGNAYAENYFAPNRVIPKSERPKWRFLVKRYIKEFLKIKAGNVHYPEMVRLFTELYKLLCTACNYYLFSTEVPFRSIGWQQPYLFQVLLKKTFEDGYTKENIASAIAMAVKGGISPENLSVEPVFVLVGELKTSDVKYLALEEIKTQTENEEKCLANMKKNSNDSYFVEETVNHLCDMFLIISIELAEMKKGLDYYFAHCRKNKRETVLYDALEIAEWMEDEDEPDEDTEKLWLDIYRYGLKKKIKPSEYIEQKYQELIQNQENM